MKRYKTNEDKLFQPFLDLVEEELLSEIQRLRETIAGSLSGSSKCATFGKIKGEPVLQFKLGESDTCHEAVFIEKIDDILKNTVWDQDYYGDEERESVISNLQTICGKIQKCIKSLQK
jgi:hypothetical protein